MFLHARESSTRLRSLKKDNRQKGEDEDEHKFLDLNFSWQL